MWIDEVDIQGFKHLQGEWRFAQGLTVVTGPNESGKSTLHEALIRVLFGFSASERRKRSGGDSVKDEFAPWSGAPYAANATLREVKRTSIGIEWDFAEHSLTVRDATTGEDLSGHVRRKRQEVALGEYLLGLGREEFREVCCLHQAAAEAVGRTEDLVLALQRSVEAGAKDVGVEEAEELLNAFLRERIGVHVRHLTETKGGELARLKGRCGELECRLQDCERTRDQIAQMAARLTERKREEDELDGRSRRLEQQSLLTELRDLDARLTNADELRRKSGEQPAEVTKLPKRIVDGVRSIVGALERSDARIRELEEVVEQGADDRAALEQERDRVTTAVDALEAYASADASQEGAVRELKTRWEDLAEEERPEPVEVPEPDPVLTRYRADRSRLLALAREAGSAPHWEARRLAVAAAVAALSVIAGVLAHPAAFGALPVAAVVAALARRRAMPGGLDGGLAEALQPFGASSIEELDRRVGEEERTITAATTLAEERSRQVAKALEEREEVARSLGECLDAAGAPPLPDLEERISAYLIACEKHRERSRHEGELAKLEAKLLVARQPQRDLDAQRDEQRTQREELRGYYEELGIDASDLDRAAEEFKSLEARAAAEARQAAEAETAVASLSALLGGETIEELARRAEEAKRRHREHVALHGGLVDEVGDADALKSELADVRNQVGDLKLEMRELDYETLIGDREEGLDEPAELEEEIAEVKERLAKLERARDAIKVARETLKEAAKEAHRAFAPPHLNAALRENLAQVTGNRYEEAVVDDDLRIRVVAPETGRLVPVGVLSRGTQDQIYMVERLEIARLLDPTTGEAPLLLDDPFARFDETRLVYGLEIIRDVTAECQVVLFTEDQTVVELAREVTTDCELIELPGPG